MKGRRQVALGLGLSLGLGLALGLACGRSGFSAAVQPRCEDSGLLRLSCEPGSQCTESSVVFEAEPPNVLLVLDRSCSMEARWDRAVFALRDVLDRRGAEAAWGLSMFPDRQLSQCVQGELLTPIRLGAHTGIADRLVASLDPQDPSYPSGPCITNIGSAIGQAAGAFGDSAGQRVVLLITDGWDQCDSRDAAASSTELLEQMRAERGIATYIISFPSNVSTEQLEQFAVAGGTARDGTPAYYPTDGEDLGQIVDQIVGGLRCTYTMQIDPTDLPHLRVRIDDGPSVPRDPTDGWTYDEVLDRLTFHGESCRQLQDSSLVLDLDLGC